MFPTKPFWCRCHDDAAATTSRRSAPELRIDTTAVPPEGGAELILGALRQRGIVDDV